MNDRNPETLVLDAVANCTVLAATLAVTVLLYQLIAGFAPLADSVVFPQIMTVTGW